MVLGGVGLYFGIKGCFLSYVEMYVLVPERSGKLCHGAVGRDYHSGNEVKYQFGNWSVWKGSDGLKRSFQTLEQYAANTKSGSSNYSS